MAHEITIPRLGWSMEEGTFVGWLKNDGDQVQRGDVLFELEGEKACQEIEAVDEGVLRIPADGPRPGAVLKVGAIVGYLVSSGETAPHGATTSAPESEAPGQASHTPAAAPSVRRLARQTGVPLSDLTGSGPGGRVLHTDVQSAARTRTESRVLSGVAALATQTQSTAIASPRARRIAKELGIDWRSLQGSGTGGRIREQDVRSAAASGDAKRTTAGSRVPMTSRRKLIAQRMVVSRQQTVPVTLTSRADATNLVNLRDQFKSLGDPSAVPSYQDIITKLVAEALRENSSLGGRWDDDAILIPGLDGLHLGMAVDTDDGLLVPVIRNVLSLSLADLSRESRRLIARARAGELTAAEMQGGVFTITNLGAFGIDAFTPVINYPESAILGLGAIRREPVVLDDGSITARHQITLSLTFDHRILDGAPAARFLQDLTRRISNPSASLLSR